MFKSNENTKYTISFLLQTHYWIIQIMKDNQ